MPAAKDEFTQPELLYQTVENDILKKIVSGELPGGSQIPIEERSHDEVRSFRGAATALSDTPVYNPAFDVTPHENIRAIITEKGIISHPDTEAVQTFFDKHSL